VFKKILFDSFMFQFAPALKVNPGNVCHSVSENLASGESVLYSFPLYVTVSLIPTAWIKIVSSSTISFLLK